MNYYEILQVSPAALPEVIHMAYKALAKKYHPDLYQGDKKYAEEKMKLITAAYRVLSDPRQRQEYDNIQFNQKKSDNGYYKEEPQSQKSSDSQNNAQKQSSMSPTEKALRLFTQLFRSFIEHSEYATAHLSELMKLTAQDDDLQYMLKILENNYENYESDFFIPGAMLIVLEKHKEYSVLNEYQNICREYSSFMNKIYDISFPLKTEAVSFTTPLGENYYSLVKKVFSDNDGFQGRLLVKDTNAYRAAFNSYQAAMREIMSRTPEEEKRIEKEKKERERLETRPFRFIDCWCDPFSFYPESFSKKFTIMEIKGEPSEVCDRYLSFAKKLAERKIGFSLICHCLKKIYIKDTASYKNAAPFVRLITNMSSATDCYHTAWWHLRNTFPENSQLHINYIAFITKRIDDNFDKIKAETANYLGKSTSPVSLSLVNDIKRLDIEIAEIFDDLRKDIKRAPEAIHSTLYNLIESQSDCIKERHNDLICYTEKAITDHNLKKYWMPQNRCRHCGGNFRHIMFTAYCRRCGKKKDY